MARPSFFLISSLLLNAALFAALLHLLLRTGAAAVLPAAAALALSAAVPAMHAGSSGAPADFLPLHPLSRFRGVPTRMVMYDDLDAAAVAATEPMRWGGRGAVAFVSGNEWMVDFMLNEMLHMAQHAVPFSMLWVPLDEGAVSRLRASGNGSAYAGVSKSGRFVGHRSDFRNREYNSMSLFKWEFSLQLLERGYDVFMLDPDLVIKRNPLPYIETLGDCDFYSSLDSVDFEPTGPAVREKGGYVCHDKKIADNYYNTGGVFMRARPRTIAWLRGYFAWASSEFASGSTDDDQVLFNRYVNDHHVMRMTDVLGKTASTGAYTSRQVMSNGCLAYAARREGAIAAADVTSENLTAVTMYPLNPYLFPNSRHVDSLTDKILHRPYWWHANWVHGGGKQGMIAARGDWLVPAVATTSL